MNIHTEVSQRSRLYPSILETIGGTPTVRLAKLSPEGVEVYVKAEFFNPGGSVKDRLAKHVIERAERSGALVPGQTVVEASGGNTGIGLAMVCAQKGYPLVVTMSESFSVERRKLMRLLGAKVVTTPAAERGFGMHRKAVELAEKHGWFLARQFETAANADIHEATTGREIIDAFEGHRLDAFVSGFGTGGTITGVARALRWERPETRIILAEPDTAQIVASGQAQERNADGTPSSLQQAFEPHSIQGWTPDFIPLVLQEAINNGLYDALAPVSGVDAIEWAHRLARMEGILTGISGGASLAVAMRIAQDAPRGSVVLCMLPDTGERYLSTPLFEGISAEMNASERALSRSTPSARTA